MPRRSRLLCPCRRAELILDRLENEICEVLISSLFNDVHRPAPLLREMWNGQGARRLGRGVFLTRARGFFTPGMR
jgi:hypothetical protein